MGLMSGDRRCYRTVPGVRASLIGTPAVAGGRWRSALRSVSMAAQAQQEQAVLQRAVDGMIKTLDREHLRPLQKVRYLPGICNMLGFLIAVPGCVYVHGRMP